MELEKCGYDIIHAMTGEAAVSIIKENEIIHLVLIDIDLGRGIDGIETARLILEYKGYTDYFRLQPFRTRNTGKN